MKRIVIPGINIQFPISQLILEGRKIVETRTYPLPEKYVGVPIALIETPGKEGDFKARITAIIEFKNSFLYSSSEEFYLDYKRHKVDPKSLWKWNPKKPKHGWPVKVIWKLPNPTPAPKRRGIVFTQACEVNLKARKNLSSLSL